jgi:hypothetical protein
MPVDLNFTKYMNVETRVGFYRTLIDEVDEHPDVISTAVSATFPLNEVGRHLSSS